jgi:hypothetical protein
MSCELSIGDFVKTEDPNLKFAYDCVEQYNKDDSHYDAEKAVWQIMEDGIKKMQEDEGHFDSLVPPELLVGHKEENNG